MTSWIGFQRLVRALAGSIAFAVAVAAVTGCSDGTTGAFDVAPRSGGGSGSPLPDSDPDPQPSPAPAPTPPADSGGDERIAMLAWAPASGPVAGYRVFIEWDGGGRFAPHQDVPGSVIFVRGNVGQTMRMQVAALDDTGAEGPRSASSKAITFTTSMPVPGGGGGTVGGASAPAAAPADDAPLDLSRQLADAEPEAADPSDPGEPELPPAPGAPGDVDGDGRPDLLWERPGHLRITDVTLAVWHELAGPGDGWSLAGTGDADGDGRTDLWWQNDAGDVALTRASALWAMPDVVPLEPWARLAPGERIERVADFDADGLADALVAGADEATLWLSRETAFELVALAPPDATADRIVAAADLDGDGYRDLVWSTDAGALLAQFLVAGRGDGLAPIPGSGTPLAVGDFDGDRAESLLFLEAGGWVAHGLRASAGPWDPAQASGTLVGCADYDGDGTADLLWHEPGLLHFAYLPGAEAAASDPAWSAVPLCP